MTSHYDVTVMDLHACVRSFACVCKCGWNQNYLQRLKLNQVPRIQKRLPEILAEKRAYNSWMGGMESRWCLNKSHRKFINSRVWYSKVKTTSWYESILTLWEKNLSHVAGNFRHHQAHVTALWYVAEHLFLMRSKSSIISLVQYDVEAIGFESDENVALGM